MTTIITEIDLDAAIRAGIGDEGSRAIQIDPATLSPAQREALLEQRASRNQCEAHNVPSDTPVVRGVAAHTIDEVLRVLDARVPEVHRRAAEKAEVERRIQTTIDAARTAPIDTLVDVERKLDLYYFAKRHHIDLPWNEQTYNKSAAELAGRLDEANALIAQRRAEREAREAREAEEKAVRAAQREAEHAAARERLRAWATEHGSERLRTMLEMQVGDWEDVAEDEYLDAHTPEGYDNDTYRLGDDSPREKPQLHELQELRALRALVEESGGVLRDPGLYWHVVEEETDDDGDVVQEAERFASAHVTVVAPNGTSKTVARRL